MRHRWLLALLAACALDTAWAAESRASRAARVAFDRLDRDRDGALTPGEWGRAAASEADLPIDEDADGRLSREEFAASASKVRPPGVFTNFPELQFAYEEARAIEATGQLEKAAVHLRSLRNDLGDHRAHAGLAAALLGLGRHAEAAAAARRGLADAPNSMELSELLARASQALGRREEARRFAARAAALSSFRDQVRSRHFPSPAAEGDTQALCELAELVFRRDYTAALQVAPVRAAAGGWPVWLALCRLQAFFSLTREAKVSLERAAARGAPPALLGAYRVGLLLDEDDRAGALAELAWVLRARVSHRDQFEAAYELALRKEWDLVLEILSGNVELLAAAPEGDLLLAVAAWQSDRQALVRALVDGASEALACDPAGFSMFARLAVAIGRVEQALSAMAGEVRVWETAVKYLELARAQRIAGDVAGEPGAVATGERLVRPGSALGLQFQARRASQPTTAPPLPQPAEEPFAAPPGY